MKLNSINLARATWLFPVIDLNPTGKSLYPVVEWLIVNYKFKKYPATNDEFDLAKGIKFESGEYKTENGEVIIINLTVYNDGIIADSRHSTKESDKFLNEMLTHVSANYNLPDYRKIIRRKGYLSNVYVTTDKALEMLNPKLKRLSDYISNNFSDPPDTHYELGTISFWPEQGTSAMRLPLFTFERAANVPFSENRYFSSAGLQTDKHIEALNKLEKILIE